MLVVFFRESSFLEICPEGDSRPADAVLDGFEMACEALQPDAAVVMTRPHQIDVDGLGRFSERIVAGDPAALTSERFGLLYVSDRVNDDTVDLEDHRVPDWYTGTREAFRGRSGWFIFAGAGAKRWW